VLPILALALPAAFARAQELAMPAVDDLPTAQLLVEQASDQAKANPREAVRLLVQALDSGADRLVRAGRDPDLFVPVSRRVHAMLAADPALRAAFRVELSPDADAQLARGDLAELVAHRLDTDAGLEAALRLAQSSIARGWFAAASAYLDRVSDHDLLAGRRALHHAAMTATVAARLGQPGRAESAIARIDRLAADRASGIDPAELAGARAAAAAAMQGMPVRRDSSATFGPLAAGRLDAGSAAPASAWTETWNAPIDTPTLIGSLLPAAERTRPAPSVAPSVVGERVFVDDGSAVRAFDRLSGRPLWTTPTNGPEPTGGAHMVAATEDAVVSFGTAPASAVGRAGTGRVACIDPSTGFVRWESRLDRLDARADLDGLQPQGAPIVVDGRAIVSARRTSPRLETVSWLVAVDLEHPRPLAWARVVATSGSIRFGTVRAAESPVLSGGVLYLATATGAVAAVDPWDGLVRWLRRMPVPVREASASEAAGTIETPAVVGGRVWAIAPDHARIRAYDARDGSFVDEIPTGADGAIGAPAYLVGDDASGLVLAVGERVTCFAASAPRTTRWSHPALEDPPSHRVRGRVQFALTADPASPSVLVPELNDSVLIDARTGAESMRLAGAGNTNGILAGNQLLAAGATALSGWMPAADAERIVRARMAAGTAPEDAMALLHLARQVRSGRLAADGAAECVRRLRAQPSGDAARTELLDLLLAIDALDLASGNDRAALDAAVDEAAVLAGAPVRGGFARADRALRRGDPAAAVRSAVATALAAPAGESIRVHDGFVGPEAEARRIIVAARTSAAEVATSALAASLRDALSKAVDAHDLAGLRSVARLGAGSKAGADALAAATALATTP
jgi:hypothetical protein